MKAKGNIKNTIPASSKTPFRVPDGYFDTLHDRVMEGIRKEATAPVKKGIRTIHFNPYFAVAASLAGVALITYILLQTVLGPNLSDDSYYELSLLEDSGILYDETVVAESYSDTQNDNYTEWEEGAITFLASNEVDLFQLLESY